jgi:hypothetical protein
LSASESFRPMPQVEAINRIAEYITQAPVGAALESSIRTLEELGQRLAEVNRTRDDVAEQATIADIELYERKAKVWRSFLEKESVASSAHLCY